MRRYARKDKLSRTVAHVEILIIIERDSTGLDKERVSNGCGSSERRCTLHRECSSHSGGGACSNTDVGAIRNGHIVVQLSCARDSEAA